MGKKLSDIEKMEAMAHFRTNDLPQLVPLPYRHDQDLILQKPVDRAELLDGAIKGFRNFEEWACAGGPRDAVALQRMILAYEDRAKVLKEEKSALLVAAP